MFRPVRRNVVLLIPVLGLAGLAALSCRANGGGSPTGDVNTAFGELTGTVKTVSGEPAVGALVRVRNGDRGLAFTVVSQHEGHYRVSNLPPGRYAIQAKGGGFRNDSTATAQVSGGGAASMDVALNLPQSPAEAMTSTDYINLMPEGEAKYLTVARCALCHEYGLREVVTARHSREEWKKTIEDMRRNRSSWATYKHGAPPPPPTDTRISDRDVNAIAGYLAAHFGPNTPPLDPGRDVPKTWVPGEASNYRVTEFDLPEGLPHDVAVDSQGIGWSGDDGRGMIVRIDPDTLTYTRIPLPGQIEHSAHNLVVDPQDRIWVADGRSDDRRLVRYDPRTKEFAIYPGHFGGTAIRFHQDGTVWMDDGGLRIVHLEPATKTFTAIDKRTYDAPGTERLQVPQDAAGIAIDGSGGIWFFDQFLLSTVGRLDPTSGRITKYDVPAMPKGMLKRLTTDSDRNVWVTSYFGQLIKIDYRTKAMTVHSTPTKIPGNYWLDADRKRNHIWFSEQAADKIARFDPRMNRFEEFPLFGSHNEIKNLTVDPRNGRVWFGAYHNNVVGFLDVLE